VGAVCCLAPSSITAKSWVLSKAARWSLPSDGTPVPSVCLRAVFSNSSIFGAYRSEPTPRYRHCR
jgi:hypothetical protein